eukprot:scaffold64960_cov38-Prasinocladus_malaysianus.AAC.2
MPETRRKSCMHVTSGKKPVESMHPTVSCRRCVRIFDANRRPSEPASYGNFLDEACKTMSVMTDV